MSYKALKRSYRNLVKIQYMARHSLYLTNSKVFTCKSDNLKLNFEVHVENETKFSNQKCFIMTLHDLGSNHTQFEKLIQCEQMIGLRNRVIWLNVNLPGQEPDAEDLALRKYPTLEEIAEELVCVLDFLKIPQVICLGEGAGANISAFFSMKHPSRCLGVVLIDAVASSASLMESIKYKLNHFNFLNKTKLNISEKRNFIFNRFDTTSSSEIDALNIEVEEFNHKIFENHNAKNLALFAEAFFKIDALIAVGKNSPVYHETKRIYKALQEINKKTPQRMVNSPYVELDNVSNVLKECPDRLATSFQFFLQGIGLLSAMPMSKKLRSLSIVSSSGQSSYGKSFDETESRSHLASSSSSSQSESNSQHVSLSHQSLNENSQ